MTVTANLSLIYLNGTQLNSATIVNEALVAIDSLVQCNVIDFVTDPADLDEVDGHSWIVGVGATGILADHDHDMVTYIAARGGYAFRTPKLGWRAEVVFEETQYRFDGSIWSVPPGGGTVTDDSTSTLTNKTISADDNTISDLTTAEFATNVIDTDVTLAADSDTRLATQKAVKAYIAAYIAAQNVMAFKGVIDCSANPNYPAADAGAVYSVSVAGKIGGASGANVGIGDRLLCLVDSSASGDHATVGANWHITETNLDGAVTGPASAVNLRLARYNGTSGKIIDDSGVATSTDGTLASNSDAKLPTEQAVKTYADGKVGGSTGSTDNVILRSDGTAGKTAQATGVAISDTDEISGYKGNINAQTGTTYTLQASDTGKIITFNNASAITVTAPSTLLPGWNATIVAKGAGLVTITAGSGATVYNRQSHTKLAAQRAIGLLFVEGNSGGSAAIYYFGGDTAA